MVCGVNILLFWDIPNLYCAVSWCWSKNWDVCSIEWKTDDWVCMTTVFKLFAFVGEFFRFFTFALKFPSQSKLRFNSFKNIKVPEFNLGQEATNNGIISLFMFIRSNGSEINSKPLNIQWERWKHDFMMNIHVISLLFIDINFKTGVLFFLIFIKCHTTLPATIKASVSLI